MVPTVRRLAVLTTLCAGLVLPGAAAAWCTKVTTLNGLNQRFPQNLGPDVVVRVDLGASIQEGIDAASDVNGDGYIIVGAVNGGSGQPYGRTAQRVVVDRVFPLPFGLLGCSLTLVDPRPADGLPTAHITASAGGPGIFVMDLHATGSPVAGWLIEGDGRYVRNAYAKDNALGYWVIGDGNTVHNGVAEGNDGPGALVEGDGNTVTGNKVVANGGAGIQVLGDGNNLKQNRVGDRGAGNGGNGIEVRGAGNVVQENQVYASGGHGIEVAGGGGAAPNRLRKNSAGDKTKGNLGHGIFVHDDTGNGRPVPLELEQNTARANRGHGIFIADGAAGHALKGNISGGKDELDNGDCEFLVAGGNVNATGNVANGITVPGRDGDAFPAGCLGTP